MKATIYTYRLPKLLFVLTSFISIFYTTDLIAQNEDVTEAPYFTVFCNDTSNVAFPLIATNVDATISGVIANIVTEQVYVNSGDSLLDATYVFPMSTNAAIYSMQMQIEDRVIDAVIERNDVAQEIFDEANENGYTASLLEQNRPNVFQMSLANIQPGDTLIVRMTYTELMEPENGEYQFVLPSIVGPRFTTNGETWVQQSIEQMEELMATEWNIQLDINAGMPVEAYCASHPLEFDNQGYYSTGNIITNPEKDFIVNYSLRGNNIETGLLLYEGEEENFFLSIMQPPKPEIEFEMPDREYVFIMDVSGSMNGYPIETSKELIVNLLNGLNLNDKFNILFFAGGSSLLSETSLYATHENVNNVIEMIENMSSGGSTDLLPAMQRALDLEGSEDYARTFVIVTDGRVTVEKEAYDLIRENLNEANFFAFGIGNNPNRFIIEGIAYVGEGEAFIVPSSNEAEATANLFKEYIERPALTNIEASFSGVEVYDVEPFAIPDIFAERPIILYGKYENETNGSVTVTGDYGSGEVSSTLNFSDYNENIEDNIALKYLWARKRIKLMSDYGIASNETDSLSIEEEITQLGLQYSLITEYTSFIAVDSSALANNTLSENNYVDDYLVSIDDLVDSTEERETKIHIIGENIIDNNFLEINIAGINYNEFDDLTINIIDVTGKVLFSQEISEFDLGKNMQIDFGNLASGYYFVTLSSKQEVIDAAKFMISK